MENTRVILQTHFKIPPTPLPNHWGPMKLALSPFCGEDTGLREHVWISESLKELRE